MKKITSMAIIALSLLVVSCGHYGKGCCKKSCHSKQEAGKPCPMAQTPDKK
jgi:hypothetical protein